VPRFALPSWVLPWVLVPAAVVAPSPRPFLLLGGPSSEGRGLVVPSRAATPRWSRPLRPGWRYRRQTPSWRRRRREALRPEPRCCCLGFAFASFVLPLSSSLLERIGSGPRQVRLFPVRDWISPRIDDAFSHECTEKVMLQERDILGAHGKPALLACGWHPWSVQAHTAVLRIWTSLDFWVLEWSWNFLRLVLA